MYGASETFNFIFVGVFFEYGQTFGGICFLFNFVYFFFLTGSSLFLSKE
jgi:hypothetical protein